MIMFDPNWSEGGCPNLCFVTTQLSYYPKLRPRPINVCLCASRHSRMPICPSLMLIGATIKQSVCLYWAPKNKTKPSIAHPHYLHPMVMFQSLHQSSSFLKDLKLSANSPNFQTEPGKHETLAPGIDGECLMALILQF